MLTNQETSGPAIGVLVGSTRQGAFTQQLADRLPALTQHHLVQLRGLDELPYFNQDLEDAVPASVAAFRAAVGDVDALLVITPEYNAGIPGMLKNALDWASRPRQNSVLGGMPAAVIGASPSPGGGVAAADDATRVLTRALAAPLGTAVTVPSVHQQLADGADVPAELVARLTGLVDDLAQAASGQSAAA